MLPIARRSCTRRTVFGVVMRILLRLTDWDPPVHVTVTSYFYYNYVLISTHFADATATTEPPTA